MFSAQSEGNLNQSDSKSASRPRAIGISIRSRKIAVVAHNVAGDFLYPASGDLIGKFRQDLLRRPVEFFFRVQGKFAIGKVRVAAANQNQIPRQPS